MNVPSGASWAGTGLDPLAGKALEHLVGHPDSTADAVAAAVGASPTATSRALQVLETELLAVRAGDQPARWTASPPRPALGSLLARRREELARVELYVEQLHDAYRSAAGHRTTSEIIEVLESGSQVAARYAQLLRSSRYEVLHIAKPPYVTSLPDTAEQPGTAGAALRHGVRLRFVYDSEGLTDAVSLETAVRGTAMGGELRLGSGLPMKLALFDDAAGIMPLRRDDPAAGSVVVHSPTLLHALKVLFEGIWERAVPMPLPNRQEPATAAAGSRTDGLDDRTREILRLMSVGMKDEAIARVMRLSRRTIQKHISEAGKALGGRTRFQIALLASEAGWLDRSS